MSNKCEVRRGLVHCHMNTIGGSFLHYALSCGDYSLFFGERDIDDVIDALIELREKKIIEFGRVSRSRLREV